MVGRELHTLCPTGEDHQGACERRRGGGVLARLDAGRSMIGSRKLKVKTITGRRLNFTDTENKSKPRVMSFISLVQIWSPRLDTGRVMIL